MQIGRVIGTVVSTRKVESIEGLKLLVVAQVDIHNQEKPSYVVAVDSVQAGVGDLVLYASGSAARQTDITLNKPADAIVMAVIDSWDIGGQVIYSAGK
ncbi:MAG: EutN/CcmL family microcompartment protein [bacterium]